MAIHETKESREQMPVLFIGHGSPVNAIEENEFTGNWKRLADLIPKPEAILCVSAHWLKEGTAVTAMEKPRTIHDFYGFPEKLYEVKYPAKGSPEHAALIKKAVKAVAVEFDYEWGLDHGTWSVLRNMYPKADVPVVQLSLDYQLALDKAFQAGKELSCLRKEGVLIIGSGNLVHNLMVMRMGMEPELNPYDWAIDFDKFVKENLTNRSYDKIINYMAYPSAAVSHPTNDHYLPLLYTIGAAENEEPQFFNERIIYGSISMRCAVFGMEKSTGKNLRNLLAF